MSKRKLSRQQRWRVEKIQAERAQRATRRDVPEDELLAAGDYGPEQPGRVIAHFGRTLDVRPDAGGEVIRCHLRANLEGLVTGDRVVWRGRTDAEGRTVEGVVVARGEARDSVLERPDAARPAQAGGGQYRPDPDRLRGWNPEPHCQPD